MVRTSRLSVSTRQFSSLSSLSSSPSVFCNPSSLCWSRFWASLATRSALCSSSFVLFVCWSWERVLTSIWHAAHRGLGSCAHECSAAHSCVQKVQSQDKTEPESHNSRLPSHWDRSSLLLPKVLHIVNFSFRIALHIWPQKQGRDGRVCALIKKRNKKSRVQLSCSLNF